MRMTSCKDKFGLYFLLLILLLVSCTCDDKKNAKKKLPDNEKWKKKDIRDYTDADLERLYDQWEEADEDELEEDEIPEYKKEPPKIDMSKINPNNPEEMLQMTKKGRTLMMFATVSGNPTEKETEQITSLWHSSLFNANVELQRYVVGSNRVLFMVKDGSKAWEIKDFLVQQDRCEEVTIEGRNYPGKGANKDGTAQQEKTKSDKEKANDSDNNKTKKKKKNKKEEL